VSEPAVKEEVAAAPDIDAEVEEAIKVCDGDIRAALRATLVANAYLEGELERVLEMVSTGYGRGKVRQPPISKREAEKRYGLPLP
jgi:hypothetical protein